MLRVLTASRNIDIILITESWLSSKIDDRELSLTGYSLLRRDRRIGIHWGVAAFVKSSLSYETLADPMSREEHLELFAFKLHGPRQTQLDVILVYSPPSQSSDLNTFLIQKKTSRGYAG